MNAENSITLKIIISHLKNRIIIIIYKLEFATAFIATLLHILNFCGNSSQIKQTKPNYYVYGTKIP